MYQTNYHRPTTIADAISLMSKAEDGKFLSGGQTLLPTMKQRLASPSDVIDLTMIDELKGISDNGDSITVGAATTHAEVAASDIVKVGIPALAALAGTIGDPQVRHMGTLGGSIANNDPAADYPAAIVGLNASVSTNLREIPADEFFDGMFATNLEDDEIIRFVRFPKVEKSAYAKQPNPASRYAMAGVFIAMTGNNVRVAVTGAGNNGVFRVEAMEAALAEDFSAAAISNLSVDPDDMIEDLHGTGAYRANLVSVMAERAVQSAR